MFSLRNKHQTVFKDANPHNSVDNDNINPESYTVLIVK